MYANFMFDKLIAEILVNAPDLAQVISEQLSIAIEWPKCLIGSFRVDHLAIALSTRERLVEICEQLLSVGALLTQELAVWPSAFSDTVVPIEHHKWMLTLEIHEILLVLLAPVSHGDLIWKHILVNGEGIHHMAILVEDLDCQLKMKRYEQHWQALGEATGGQELRQVFLSSKIPKVAWLLELIERKHHSKITFTSSNIAALSSQEDCAASRGLLPEI